MDFVGMDMMSLLDYEDKISAVLFTKDCNFRCPFCHNGTTLLTSETFTPFNEILEYLEKRKGVLDAVVISGGEPTLMKDLKEKIIAIKKLGYLIKLDTNGTHPEVIKDLIDNKLIDYVAMDIKNSEKKYPLITQNQFVNMAKIKESISLLKNSDIEYEFRTTLVSEFHTLNDMEEMGNLIKGAKILYLQKFVDREGCLSRNLHEVNEKDARIFASILSKYVKQVELRGY